MPEDQTIINSKKYIQAPLCLLAYPGSLDDIINGMLYIGIHRTRLFLSENPEQHYELPDNEHLPKDHNNTNGEHQLLCAAANMLEINTGPIAFVESEIRKYQAFVDDLESKFKNDALVRHKKALCLDVRDRGALNPREFAILSAIYSRLGQSSYKRITSDEIQCRATGCRSKEIFDTFEERPEPYSMKQVRKTVEDLFLKGFFGRYTYQRRYTYYSHKLSEDELRKKVFEMRTNRMRKKKSIKAKDAAINKRLMKLKMG